jgi:glycosyltransferase involved in cell wall biosynthesis
VKICIDIQSAIAQRAGVGRYTRELVHHLGMTAGDSQLRLFYFDFKRKGTPFETPNATHHPVHWLPGRLAQLAWKTINWPSFDFFAGPADLYHFPNFILPPLKSGRALVTIHDMSFLRFPEFADERNLKYLSARIRDTVKRADAIITDSQFSAKEIQALLSVDPAKIFPIHLGIEESFKVQDKAAIQPTLTRLGLNRPYLLTVGTLEPRKVFPFLIEVFEKLTDFDGDLVIAGMPGWKYEPTLERIRNSSRAANIRWLNFVEDSQLPALYAGAELFLFTSLYEGFGFPPLEAMACGTPVLSSAHGSLKEVLGSGAMLMETFDSDLWSSKANIILSEPDCRRMMVAYGLRQVSKYSWEDTAKKTWEVYRKVAG